MIKNNYCSSCGAEKEVVARVYIDEDFSVWIEERTCFVGEYTREHTNMTVHQVYCSYCGIVYHPDSI